VCVYVCVCVCVCTCVHVCVRTREYVCTSVLSYRSDKFAKSRMSVCNCCDSWPVM